MIKVDKLCNGITLVTEQMENYRSVAIGIWVKIGSAYENDDNNGISHVIEHMLFKGTKNRTAKQLAEDASILGDDINAYTSKDVTCYYVKTIDENVEIAVDILSDMLLNSLIDKRELEKEKSVILDEIDMYEDLPEDLLADMIQMGAWKEHTLGQIISGTKDIVKKITVSQIKEFMNEYYVGENITISVAGNINQEEISELIINKFQYLKSGKPIKEYDKPIYNVNFQSKNKNIEQIHLCFTYDGISKSSSECYILETVVNILGGSSHSRLFQTIREDKGLAYIICTYTITQLSGGLIPIYVAMNPEQLEETVDLVFDEINQFVLKGITEEELNKTKRELITGIILSTESTYNHMNSNAKDIIFRKRIVSTDEMIDNLNKITLQEANDFIKKYFQSSKLSMSILGNIDKKVEKGIKQRWKKMCR